jgi:hypothetical protein
VYIYPAIAQIHRNLLRKATFNNILGDHSWRVDMNALSKTSAELNEPIASFELHLSNHADKSVARFDMNRDELNKLLEQFQTIQTTFETLASSSTATSSSSSAK